MIIIFVICFCYAGYYLVLLLASIYIGPRFIGDLYCAPCWLLNESKPLALMLTRKSPRLAGVAASDGIWNDNWFESLSIWQA